MKTWKNAEMQELSIYETAMGGKEFVKIDNNFYDENGNAFSSYAASES
jgi:hypothetical protein